MGEPRDSAANRISGSANRLVATLFGGVSRTIPDRVATPAVFAEPESKDSPLPLSKLSISAPTQFCKSVIVVDSLKRLMNRRPLLSSPPEAQGRAVSDISSSETKLCNY